jgi:hypothetical protein
VELPGRAIETYLTTHPGQFCADCLARTVGLPAGQVSMVMRRLQETRGFRAETGVCSECRRKVSVIKAVLAG